MKRINTKDIRFKSKPIKGSAGFFSGKHVEDIIFSH